MKLSPATMMFAARGLGDRLVAAGISPEMMAQAASDPRFLSAAREQMEFQQSGRDGGRTYEGMMLSMAAAHAVGRMTAAVHSLADDIETAWRDLDQQSQQEIVDMIKKAQDSGRLGMEIDAARWRNILALAEVETAAAPSL